MVDLRSEAGSIPAEKNDVAMDKMAKSLVEYKSKRCSCAGKEACASPAFVLDWRFRQDQPAHSLRRPGPCDSRINARRATATPCSGKS